MQALIKNQRINLIMEDSKESLDYLVKFEASFPKQSEFAQLLTEYLLANNSEVIEFADVELDFLEVDSENIENSKIKSAFFIAETILGPLTAEISPEVIINSGILNKYSALIIEQAQELNLTRMGLPQFKKFLEGRDPKEVFELVLSQEIKLSCFPGDALAWIAGLGSISTEQLLKFVTSEWFAKEYSSLLIEKDDFIVEDVNVLQAVLEKGIGEAAQKVLISRYQQVHPELPVVYPLEMLPELINQAESYASFKDSLFNKRILIARKEYSVIELINLDVDPLPLADALISFIKERQVSDKEFTDYIFRADAVEEINDLIISRTDYIVLDILLLNKMSNLPVLKPATVEVLSERYESWFSKDNQSKIAVEFQKYAQGIEQIPNDKEILSSFIEKSKVLYSLVASIDDSVKQGIFKNGEKLDECEFDSQGFPLVSLSKINKVLFRSLMHKGAPSDLVLYIHDLEVVQPEFRIPAVIEHPNCPLSLLEQYSDDRNSFINLVRNPALPQEILRKMADSLGSDDANLFKAIVNHPNCSKELKEMILNDFAGYIQELKNSQDNGLLAGEARKLLVYPTNWHKKFQLEVMQKHDALRIIMKNRFTPFATLEQLLNYYEGFESDPSEAMASMREGVLNRPDCPEWFLRKMIDSGFSSIRLEVINSNKFVDEELINYTLDLALNDFLESIGTYKLSSRTFLESSLSPELKAIINSAPFPSLIKERIQNRVSEEIKKEIVTASNLDTLKGIFNFLKKNDLVAGIIEIGEVTKNELLKAIQLKVPTVLNA